MGLRSCVLFAGYVSAPHVQERVGLARQMPMGLPDMHPSSEHTLAELLQGLGVKLIQGAVFIR